MPDPKDALNIVRMPDLMPGLHHAQRARRRMRVALPHRVRVLLPCRVHVLPLREALALPRPLRRAARLPHAVHLRQAQLQGAPRRGRLHVAV